MGVTIQLVLSIAAAGVFFVSVANASPVAAADDDGTKVSPRSDVPAEAVGNFVPILETAVHHGRIPTVVYKSSATGLRVAFVQSASAQRLDNDGYMTLAAEKPRSSSSGQVQHVLEPQVFMGSAKNERAEVLDHLARRCLASGNNEALEKQRRPCYKVRVSGGTNAFCTSLPMYLGRADLVPHPSKAWVILTGISSDPADVLGCLAPIDAKLAAKSKIRNKRIVSLLTRRSHQKSIRTRRNSFFRSHKKNDNAYLTCLCGRID